MKLFLSNLAAQMELDLKAYVKDNTPAVKTKQLDVLESTLGIIPNPATVASLKSSYGNALDSYVADLQNIDALVQMPAPIPGNSIVQTTANGNRLYAPGHSNHLYQCAG